MRLGDDVVQIVPFESGHALFFYHWHLSGKYKSFFGNLEMMSLEKWAQLKNAYMIVDPKDISKVYGCFLLQDIDQKNKNISLHLLIDEQFQKQGIAKKAAKYFLFYVFNHLNFYKIIGRTAEENLATIRLFDIFGFKLEGHLKKHMLVDGDRLDVVQYSLMKPQFSREIGDKLKSVMERVESAA